CGERSRELKEDLGQPVNCAHWGREFLVETDDGEARGTPRHDNDSEMPPTQPTEIGKDTLGIISMVCGTSAVALLLAGTFGLCCTCGMSPLLYHVAILPALAGALIACYARTRLRTAGIALNSAPFIPAVVLSVLLFIGMLSDNTTPDAQA